MAVKGRRKWMTGRPMSDVFIHPNALCESRRIGPGTHVWAFAHVLPNAVLGADCNICDGVFIENDVVVGDRVTVKCGVQLWDGVVLEDDVFVGPNVTFTNDRFPRSKVYPDRFSRTIVRRGASIGANATILSDLEIGVQAMVAAGAVVTKSVPPNAIVIGNPARITGYVDAQPLPDTPHEAAANAAPGATAIGVGGATLHRLRMVKDLRGDLSVGEFSRDIPFVPRRYFTVFNVASKEVRGEHAHRECHQFLVCVRGSCQLLLDDGCHRREVSLDQPDIGVYMPPMIWGTQYRYSEDAFLLVFASAYYDNSDYIRDYGEFCRLVGSSRQDG